MGVKQLVGGAFYFCIFLLYNKLRYFMSSRFDPPSN